MVKIQNGKFTFESNTVDNSNLLLDIYSPKALALNMNNFVNLVYNYDFIKLYEGESVTKVFTFNQNTIKNISSKTSYFIFAETK